MPGGAGGRYDFFVSRRGSVSTVAQEVADVLIDKGYAVIVQDYDIPFTANFIEAMHEAIKNSRDLVVLFTRDYEESPHTRNEFTSFQADAAQSAEPRRIVILRCEDVPLRGFFAPNVYQDLVGIDAPQERKRRIIAAAEGNSQGFKAPQRPFVGVPPRVANFTGRADAFDRLDAILMGDKKPGAITQASVGRAAVQGMGGVGKTSLAIEYAHRFRDLYAGVWWCPAETRVGLLASLAGLGGELDPALKNEADVEKAAQAALRSLAEQRATWLLAYDNVTGPEAIADLLPSAGARVLLTSRFSDFASWAEEVALDVLPLGEATGFLQSHTSRTDAAGATILAEALGRLPLALDHAGAYCKRTQMRFADYAAKAECLIASAPRGAAYPRSVAATFDLAIAEAVANCLVAEGLMTYLAHCAPERIPMALLEDAIANEGKRVKALAAIAEVSLLRHDPFEDGTPAVTVHRLVQTVARARAQAKGEAKASIELLVARLAAIYPDDAYSNPTSWPLCAQLTPHLLALREAAPDGVAKSALLNRAGGFFHRRGAYGQAEPLFREALAIREKALGAEHPEMAESLNNLASLLHGQGDLAEARPLFERALGVNETALGPEHPETADSLNNLAVLLHAQGDLAGARLLFERALAIYEKALGPEHPNTATSLNEFARLLRVQGDYSGARPLYERALAIRETALGPEHPYTATSLNNLAFLLQAQGDYSGARPLYERALAIREKALGAEHPDPATGLNNLALLLQAQGDLAGARLLFERALTIYEKALGPEHPSTATSLNNLAFLLQAQGDLTEARSLFERALAIREKALGPEHPSTAMSLSNLARLLRDTGHAAEAEQLFRRAIGIGEKALSSEHPLTERFQSNYARLLLDTGRTAEAFGVGEAALATHAATSGPNHPWTKDSARVTADALDALGRVAEAEAIRARYGLGQDL